MASGRVLKAAAGEQNQSLDFFPIFDGGANMAESSPSADEILSLWDFRLGQRPLICVEGHGSQVV